MKNKFTFRGERRSKGIISKVALIFIALLLLCNIRMEAQCTAPSNVATSAVVHASCPGNGQITVGNMTPSAASIAPDNYQYALWNAAGTTEVLPYQNSNILANVNAGSYQVRVRRVCTSPAGFSGFITQSVTVNNTEVMANISAITVNRLDQGCNTGRFTITATGSGPLQYALVPALATPEPVVSYVRPPQASNVFNALAAGTYYVRVYNACGNAATQAITVGAVAGPMQVNSPGFGAWGCDSFLFKFRISNIQVRMPEDTALARAWAIWPDGTTDTLPISLATGGIAGEEYTGMYGHISRIDPAYNGSQPFPDLLSNYPYQIVFGAKDICGNITTSMFTLYEPTTTSLIVSSPLVTCDSAEYSFYLQHTRSSPSQTTSHNFNIDHGYVYSTDTGNTWHPARTSDIRFPVSLSVMGSSYSTAFQVPTGVPTLLMLAYCGDTITKVLSPVLPALSATLTETNISSCLGHSGMDYNLTGLLGNSTGIEMLSAPPGQPLVPYFNHDGVYIPGPLTSLLPGTYVIRFWDTIGTSPACHRSVTSTITLSHPFDLDLTTNRLCNGDMAITAATTSWTGSAPAVINGNSVRARIFNQSGTQVLGGTFGYGGVTSTPSTNAVITVSIADINSIPDGSYTIRVNTSSGIADIDSCTAVEIPWAKGMDLLNLIPSHFMPGCPGATGSIVAVAQNGKAPYTFQLLNGVTPIAPSQPGGNIFNGLNTSTTYTLQVIDSCGTVVNRAMSVGEAPVIFMEDHTTQPCPGEEVNLAIQDMNGVNYQWFKNGNPLPGATAATLVLPSFSASDSGAYAVEMEIGDCIVTVSGFSLDPNLCGIPLPVSLLNFKASKQGNTAMLQWTTATEQNNKGFAIEHSINGKNWTGIGFVGTMAKDGNSNEKLSYDFIDKRPLNGMNYYRLKQASHMGTYVYSSIASLRFGNAVEAVTLHPNPARNNVSLQGLMGNEQIRIYNITGQLVKTIQVTSIMETIDLSGISEGVYQVNITDTTGNTVSKKLVKL